MKIEDMSAIYQFIRRCGEADLEIITNAVTEARMSLKSAQGLTGIIERIQSGNRLIALSRTKAATAHPLLAEFFLDFQDWLDRRMLQNPEDFPKDWNSASSASLKAEAEKMIERFFWALIDIASTNEEYIGSIETRSQALLSAIRCSGLSQILSTYVQENKLLRSRPSIVFRVPRAP